MTVLVLQRRIHGIEMWQVYTASGFVAQYWSKDYAEAAAQRLKK